MILTKRNLNLKFVADFKAAMNCFHKERPMRTDQFRATIKRFLIFLHLKKKKKKRKEVLPTRLRVGSLKCMFASGLVVNRIEAPPKAKLMG